MVVRLDPSRCSLVLVGAWNRAIFQPGWVKQHLVDLAEDEELQVELKIGTGEVRFTTPHIVLTIIDSRVECRPGRLSANLDGPRQVSRHLLDTLPETPLSAFGVNVSYQLAPAPSVRRMLDDLAGLADGSQDQVVMSWRTRRANHDENVRVEHTRDAEEAILDVNFHYQLGGDERPADLVRRLLLDIPSLETQSAKIASDLT